MNELDSFKTSNISGRKIKDLSPVEQSELLNTILSGTPNINELTVEQFTRAVNKRNEDRIVKSIDKMLIIKSIDYQEEKNTFLNNISKTNSKATRDGYKNSLVQLEKYCKLNNIENPLYLDVKSADNWIYYMNTTDKTKFNKSLSPSTIRRNIAGVSSFFSFLSRRYEDIKNPFLGTQARPEKKLINKAVYPTEEEIQTILNNIPNQELKTLAYFMAYRGIRCGAFQNMRIIKADSENGDRFYFETTSKGKTYRGELPKICITALHESGIKTNAREITPFKNWTADKVKNYFKYYTRKMYGENNLIHLIESPYSCHDLRHAYSIREYKSNRDIYRLKELLNHSSIATTEVYLRNLGIEI